MKDLNEGKVQQWMGLIMLSSFGWVTYFNFQGFFLKMLDSFMLLPFWWFLLVLPLFAMSIVWSISLGEDEIKEGFYSVKNLETGEQTKIETFDKLI